MKWFDCLYHRLRRNGDLRRTSDRQDLYLLILILICDLITEP